MLLEEALAHGLHLVRLKVEPELPDVEYFAIYRRATGHALAGAVAKIAKAHCNFAATSTVRSMPTGILSSSCE